MFNRLRQAARALTRRFADETHGNVAILFGLALPLLIMMTVGGIDLHHAAKVRADLQDALDAAALAAARSPHTDNDKITEVGMAALRANMPGYFNVDDKGNSRDEASFSLNSSRVVEATARVQVKTIVANIILPPYGKILDDYLPVSTASNVNRAARNVEVALVLDITGSMNQGSRLSDLKTAAKDLIDLVVQKEQSPFYSKVALVPYSMGVNAGTYATTVRGALAGPASTGISAATWAAPNSAKSISSVSRANPAVVTATGHGLQTGDYVGLSGISSMTTLNSKAYRVTRIDANRVSLNGVNTRSESRDGSGGTMTKCAQANCHVAVTSRNHGIADGEGVEISNVQGMTGLNAPWMTTRIDADTYVVPLVGPTQSAYTRNGQTQCGRDGCAVRVFTSEGGATRRLGQSTCVSERTGTDAFSDAAPSSSRWLGRNYPDTNNPCLGTRITPLSSSIDDLKDEIDDYVATGSTAGQIGIGWGWYMVSPSFASIWPAGSKPGEYKPVETLKVVVIMTDGEFNNPYCQGVISQDATNDGSAGAAAYQINCSAPNGTPFAYSAQMCKAMKDAGVVVYTVGFSLSKNRGANTTVDTAIELMETCATTKEKHFFQPDSGGDLKEAFKAIGRDITRLRISK